MLFGGVVKLHSLKLVNDNTHPHHNVLRVADRQVMELAKGCSSASHEKVMA